MWPSVAGTPVRHAATRGSSVYRTKTQTGSDLSGIRRQHGE